MPHGTGLYESNARGVVLPGRCRLESTAVSGPHAQTSEVSRVRSSDAVESQPSPVLRVRDPEALFRVGIAISLSYSGKNCGLPLVRRFTHGYSRRASLKQGMQLLLGMAEGVFLRQLSPIGDV